MSAPLLKFHCHQCNQRLSAAENLYGTSMKCPTCSASILVPTIDKPAYTPSTKAKATESKKEPSTFKQVVKTVWCVLVVVFIVSCYFGDDDTSDAKNLDATSKTDPIHKPAPLNNPRSDANLTSSSKVTATPELDQSPTTNVSEPQVATSVVSVSENKPKENASNTNNNESENDYADPERLAMYLTREQLRSPSTASFVKFRIIEQSGNLYITHIAVDAQNAYGATIRTYFMSAFELLPDKRYKLGTRPGALEVDKHPEDFTFQIKGIKENLGWPK